MVEHIELSKDLVNSIDLSSLVSYCDWHDNSKFFNLSAGNEHYKLLAYLASKIKCKHYIDIGTYFGFSALALSSDINKQVITYDICDWIPEKGSNTINQRTNITRKIMDCKKDIESLISTDLIVLDIDPHDGIEERHIMDTLEVNGYRGIVVLDDIHVNDNMNTFWNNISQKKIDVTNVGHFSGSGIVIFDPSRFDIICRQ